jgi:hypothetical protein
MRLAWNGSDAPGTALPDWNILNLQNKKNVDYRFTQGWHNWFYKYGWHWLVLTFIKMTPTTLSIQQSGNRIDVMTLLVAAGQ